MSLYFPCLHDPTASLSLATASLLGHGITWIPKLILEFNPAAKH